MRKKFTAIGNSYGIVIERPILELLHIDPRNMEVEIRTDGDRLVLEPIRKTRAQRVAKGIDDVLTAHAGTMRKLAK